MCTYPIAKKALTLHLARGEGRERYFDCNLMQRKVLASSHQHLMAEAPHRTTCPRGEQASWRKRLQWAYNRPEYEEALTALEQLHGELEERNQSAAGSLEEGLEETLTLHRLGVHAVLGRSFKTTNWP